MNSKKTFLVTTSMVSLFCCLGAFSDVHAKSGTEQPPAAEGTQASGRPVAGHPIAGGALQPGDFPDSEDDSDNFSTTSDSEAPSETDGYSFISVSSQTGMGHQDLLEGKDNQSDAGSILQEPAPATDNIVSQKSGAGSFAFVREGADLNTDSESPEQRIKAAQRLAEAELRREKAERVALEEKLKALTLEKELFEMKAALAQQKLQTEAMEAKRKADQEEADRKAAEARAKDAEERARQEEVAKQKAAEQAEAERQKALREEQLRQEAEAARKAAEQKASQEEAGRKAAEEKAKQEADKAAAAAQAQQTPPPPQKIAEGKNAAIVAALEDLRQQGVVGRDVVKGVDSLLKTGDRLGRKLNRFFR